MRDALVRHKGLDIHDDRIVRDIHRKVIKAMHRQAARGYTKVNGDV